jgi:flavodoxin I
VWLPLTSFGEIRSYFVLVPTEALRRLVAFGGGRSSVQSSLSSLDQEDVVKALVVYDSLYGHTAQVARAIGDAVAGEAEVLGVGEAKPTELCSYDLVVVGSPTQGGRATEAMRAFLTGIPALDGAKVAVFDTRLRARWVKVFGYAAGKIAEKMKSLGVTLAAEPEGFIVEGKEGPLAAGELERAAAWAKNL